MAFLAAGLAFWIVDPRGDFDTGIFPVIVRDTRAEKMRSFVAFQAQGSVDGLVLGSSRAMKIAPRFLDANTGLRFFNFAVDSARTEDDLAIARWTRTHGAHPRVVLIGLDVEALHDDNAPEPEFLKERDLRRALTGRSEVLTPVWSMKRAFTTAYAADTLSAIGLWLRPGGAAQFYFDPDGYVHDRDIDEDRAQGRFDLDARIEGCLDIYVRRFQNMSALSPQRKAYFEQTIGEIRADGGQVVVWITPLHPATIRRLEARTKFRPLYQETAEYVAGLERRGQIRAFDFGEQGRYRGTPAEWDDCAHTNERSAERIAATLTAGIR